MPQPRPQGRDPAKERHWRGVLDQWRRSGMTGRDFCARHRLSEPSFYAWKREIARRDQEQQTAGQPTPAATRRRSARGPVMPVRPVFVQVCAEAAPPAATALEVLLANGRVLRLGRGFDAEVLRQALAVLEASAC
jgi:hypothetical protein